MLELFLNYCVQDFKHSYHFITKETREMGSRRKFMISVLTIKNLKISEDLQGRTVEFVVGHSSAEIIVLESKLLRAESRSEGVKKTRQLFMMNLRIEQGY